MPARADHYFRSPAQATQINIVTARHLLVMALFGCSHFRQTAAEGS
jgi:hypothetical protein